MNTPARIISAPSRSRKKSPSVPVYNNDSIRTADDSISIIKFKDKAEIEISENSFILLTWTDDGAAVEFSKGTISARTLDSRSSKLKITSAGVAVNIKKGSIQISKTADKKLRLDVASGTAMIENKKGTSTVTEDKSALISDDKAVITKKTIRLESPGPDSYFVTYNDVKELSFKWKAGGVNDIYFEAFGDQSLTEKKRSGRAAGTSIKQTFSPGTYYWRITAGGDGESASEVRRFVILNDNQVQPLSPAEGRNFSTATENPFVTFQWTGSLFAQSYEVVIAGDPKMKNIIQSLESGGTDISTDKLSFGTYYWTIRSVYSFGKIDVPGSGTARKFTISKEKIIPPPEIFSPSENESISYLRFFNKDVLFSWASTDEIERYELSVSKDRAGKDIVLKAETVNNYYKISDNLSQGRFYLIVAGIAGGRKTLPSEPRAFSVSAARNIIALSPADGADVNLYGDQKACFRWDDQNRGERYLFEIASDKNLQNIIYREFTGETEACTGIDIKGTFFWRASLARPDGRVIISGGISSARISAELKDPDILTPANNQVIDMTDQDRLYFSWKKAEGANSYNIRVYHESGRLIFEKDTPGLDMAFARMELLDKGSFFWEIQALHISEKQIIKKSRIIKNNFSLRLKEPEKAPDIISSDTLYIK
ncbi:MAG: FecR domain-containing protein [Spirochaetes bacterium]|nr:FecR domain-containing protein [Spirochaetota bacterium]